MACFPLIVGEFWLLYTNYCVAPQAFQVCSAAHLSLLQHLMTSTRCNSSSLREINYQTLKLDSRDSYRSCHNRLSPPAFCASSPRDWLLALTWLSGHGLSDSTLPLHSVALNCHCRLMVFLLVLCALVRWVGKMKNMPIHLV